MEKFTFYNNFTQFYQQKKKLIFVTIAKRIRYYDVLFIENQILTLLW